MEEKPSANAINAVIKSEIKIKVPALYQLIDLHDMGLEKVHKKLAKSLNATIIVDNHYEHVAARFTYNDHCCQDENRDAVIQWAAGAEFCGH